MNLECYHEAKSFILIKMCPLSPSPTSCAPLFLASLRLVSPHLVSPLILSVASSGLTLHLVSPFVRSHPSSGLTLHLKPPKCEEDGQIFFSLDDGSTKFTDLIQLVEFYQLNRGVLPCKLRHPCTIVAL